MYTTTVGCGRSKEPPPLPGSLALLPECIERDIGSRDSALHRDTPAISVREAKTKFDIMLWLWLNKPQSFFDHLLQDHINLRPAVSNQPFQW
jgi:hypothetical protein